MTRSPLFYPLHRGDTDAGGAADLQTDIMRFMAILALCLVAIFALVQSIPLVPDAPATSEAKAAPPQPLMTQSPETRTATENPPPAAAEPRRSAAKEPEPAVELTRPKWVSTFRPREQASIAEPVPAAAEPEPVAAVAAAPTPPAPAPPEAPTEEGFSLRFESDLALTRLVASGQVGLYALASGHARRMAVNDSRISFWDASLPAEYHEMEAATVPRPVVDALARSGLDTANIAWGVTLPGRMRTQLDTLMRDNDGGILVIGSDGNLRREVS